MNYKARNMGSKFLIAVLLLLLVSSCSRCKSSGAAAQSANNGSQRVAPTKVPRTLQPTSSQPDSNTSNLNKVVKCSRQSVILTRQTLAHELEQINNYNSIWFNDLDKDELLEEQKQSLGSIIMSGSSSQLLDGDGRPLLDIEASYFRPLNLNHLPAHMMPASNRSLVLPAQPQPINIKLVRRHQDRCYLHTEKAQFTYVLGLSIGPIEHNLDVLYNLPKELQLSQPIDWRYAQVKLLVPRMHYEVTLKQRSNYKLDESECPIEIADVTYLSSSATSSVKSPVHIVTSGLATTNRTSLHLERLFNDYTRPTISSRLRQLLKFYLNGKTLPLSANSG